MTWNVSITVLTSVFGSIVLFSALYFVHAYLIPHLRQPKEKPDFTRPHQQHRTNHRLQESLYSLPSFNYIDPRNSIADTDLRSSRWSTHLSDLSRPSSPMSLSLPRSPAMHVRTSSHQSMQSPVHGRNTSASTVVGTPENMPKVPYEARQEPKSSKKRRTRPPLLVLAPESNGKDNARANMLGRARSKSDTGIFIDKGLLARSHAALYGHMDGSDLTSPTISNFSGTTLLSSPRTPQRRIRSSSIRRLDQSRSSAAHRRLHSFGEA